MNRRSQTLSAGMQTKEIHELGVDLGSIELEGIVIALDESTRTLTLSADDDGESSGTIAVNLPDGFDLAAFAIGDVVEIEATLNDDGTYTAVRSSHDDSVDEADGTDDDQGDDRSLGVTEGAVRQLVHRGRARLRQAAAGVVPVPLLRWLAGAAERAGRVDEAAGGVAVATGTVAAGAKIAAAVLAAGALTVGAGAEIRHLRDAPAGRLAERATGPVDASSSGARPSTGASTTSTDRAVGRSGATTVRRSRVDGPGRGGPSAQPPASSREPVELARVTTPAVGQAPPATAAPRPDHATPGAAHPPTGELAAGDRDGGPDSSQRGDQASTTESTSVSSDAPASGARSPDGTASPEGSAAVGDRDAAQQQPPTEE
ncbi:MAG: hypothetical protein QOG70_3338 [Solirubrobacteraceae bacterium]|nr:hypothetical protein [Solirubrobacteraceae bacterium]